MATSHSCGLHQQRTLRIGLGKKLEHKRGRFGAAVVVNVEEVIAALGPTGKIALDAGLLFEQLGDGRGARVVGIEHGEAGVGEGLRAEIVAAGVERVELTLQYLRGILTRFCRNAKLLD